MTCPDRLTAEKIWEGGIAYRQTHDGWPARLEQEYRFHTRGVARFSALLAKAFDIDPEKAYILGLLHDYGKRNDDYKSNIFHGLDGYYEMQRMGYDDVARICLTHTFREKDFDNEDYSYPNQWLEDCRQLLKPYSYDDYDHIVQYADMFFEGLNIVRLEDRIAGIAGRYKISPHQLKNLSDSVFKLKKIIDERCGCDSYQILGIK